MLKIQGYSRPLFWLILLLVVKAWLGGFYAFYVPLWVGYTHEIDTYNVSRIMLENGRLPTPNDFPPGEFEIRQGSQPPLYNLLTLPIVEWIGNRESIERVYHPSSYCVGVPPVLTSIQTDQDYNAPYGNAVRAGYALRLLNVAYTLGAVVAVYVAGRIAFPTYAPFALVAAGILAFEPYHIQLSAVIINDNLLLLIASIHLMLMVMAIRGFGNRWIIGGLLLVVGVLGILTKVSGWLLLGVSIGTLAMIGLSQAIKRRPTRRQVGITLGIITLLVATVVAIGSFNVMIYGGIFGRYNNLIWFGSTVLQNTDAFIRTILPTFDFTLFDYRSAIDRIPLPSRFYSLYEWGLAVLVFVPVLAWTMGIIRQDWEQVKILSWCMVLFIGGATLVVVRNSLGQIVVSDSSIIYAPIRYYAVGIPALAFSIALGGVMLVSDGRRFNIFTPIFGVGLIGAWLLLDMGAMQYYEPAKLMSQSHISSPLLETTSGVIPLPQTNDPTLTVLGYQVHPLDELNRLPIDLLMRANHPTDTNYILRISARGATHHSLSCDIIPIRGLYPTKRWQPDETIIERVALPNCSSPLDSPIQFKVEWIDPQNNESHFQQVIAELDTTMPISEGCPPNLGIVDGGIQLVKHIPEQRIVAVGDVFKPIVSWLILKDEFSMWSRTFTIVHEATLTEYSCTGSAGIHSGNSQRIEFGEIFGDFPANYLVEIDTCVIPIPMDAPTGQYQVYVSASDSAGDMLPIESTDGSMANRLLFDTMTVTPR